MRIADAYMAHRNPIPSPIRAAQIASEPMIPSAAPRVACPSSRHDLLPMQVEAVRAAVQSDKAAAERVARLYSLRQGTAETPAEFVQRIAVAMLDEMVGVPL